MLDPFALAQATLRANPPQSGESLEIFIQTTDERRYEISAGKLENVESRSAIGAAIRLLTGGRMGFAYRADTRAQSLAEAVEEARALARASSADPARTLPAPQPPTPVTLPPAEDLQAIPAEQKIELARRLEAAALAADSRVRAVHQAAYQEETNQLALVSSQGIELVWPRQAFALSLAAVAEAGGDSQIGEEYQTRRSRAALTPEEVGRAAGQRAARLLGAEPLPTGPRSLLIPPSLVTALLEAALGAWSAEAVQRGTSFLAGRLGQPIAASGVNLVDDGTLPGGLATAPVDEEGSPTQRTELIRSGMLAGFLYNHETAQRAGTRSTGNCRRPGLQAPPGIGPTNVVLLPGTLTPEQLLDQAEGALYLADVMGLHTLDAVTGGFSLGASGWLVENHSWGRPVRGVTISGQLEELFKRVEAVGNDLAAYGRFSAPTLLVRDMLVAGT